MNIWSISSILSPLQARAAKKAEQKMEQASQDRDANADFGNQQEETPDRPMTQDELKVVVERLRQLPGVQENNLVVRVAQDGGILRVFIEDIKGKVVRRFPEKDLWYVLKKTESSKGNLLNKAM